MTAAPLLMLPGLDGTGLLFKPLRDALGGAATPVCVGLPPERSRSYRELLEWLQPPDVPYAVLGESFSGPLALMLADRDPNAKAVVLVASFARSPSRLLSLLWPLVRSPLFRAGIPEAAVRRWLLGDDASDVQLAAFQLAGRFVAPRTLSARLRAIARVDAEPELARCRAPILYLRATRDRLVGADVADGMKRVNPRMEIEDVDAPHLLLQRAPEEAARRIAPFLARALGG